MGRLKKIVGKFRDEGLSGLCNLFGSVLWSRKEWVVFCKTVDPSAERPVEQENIIFRQATVDDIALIEKIWPSDLRYRGKTVEESLRETISSGEIVTIGVNRMDKTNLVFRSVLRRHSSILRDYFGGKVPEGDICSMSLWVSPSQRRKGVAVRGLHFVEALAAEQVARHMWAFVLSENEASLRLHDKLGYERIERMWYIRRLGLRFVKRERGRLRLCLPWR